MDRSPARCLFLCAAFALASTPVLGADGPRFEITPFAAARAGGGFDVREQATGEARAVDLDRGAGFGLDLGLYAHPAGLYELLYSTQRAGLDAADPALAGLDVRVDYLQVGGTALFPHERGFVPYLSMTLGATFLEPTRGGYDAETKFSGSLGGGLRFPVGDRLNVVLGLRGYVTLLDSDTKLFCLSAPPEGRCLLEASGSTLFQAEAQLGVSFAF